MNNLSQDPYTAPASSGESDRNVVLASSLGAFVLTGQLISLALALGLLLTTAVLTFVSLDSVADQPPAGVFPGEGDDLILPGIGIATALGCCVAAMIVPPVMRRRAAEKFQATGETVPLPARSDIKITPALQTLIGGASAATLIGQSLCEGAAIVNLIFMVIDEHLFHLGIVAVCVIGILIQTPTQGKLLATIENAASWNTPVR